MLSSALLLMMCGLQLAAAVANPQECFLQPSPGVQVAWPCKSTTKCYLDYLGEPKTLGEWWMAYASAVTEYCLALNASDRGCSQEEPLCQETYIFPIGPRKGQPMSSDDAEEYETLIGGPPLSECWPDWERIIRHPCIGCQDYQLFRCANAKQQTDCEALSEYCQYWPTRRASSLEQYCWPKWLLHDMHVNRTRFLQYTDPFSGYSSQVQTKHFADHMLNGSGHHLQVWSAEPPELGSCGHKQLVDALLSQLASNMTTDAGKMLLNEWSAPCIPVLQSSSFTFSSNYEYYHYPAWPYFRFWNGYQYNISDVHMHSMALLHVHDQLSMPWTRLPNLVQRDSSWQHRLSAANIECANITKIHATSCSMEANTTLHVLQGYCSVALNSSCKGSDFKQTTFACDMAHGSAQLALAAVWLVFGSVMLLVIILVEFAWSIAGILRRVLTDIQFKEWTFITRGWFLVWLQRGPASYHPAVMHGGPGGSATAGVFSWRRVRFLINNYIHAGAYVADVVLDIWTLATIFTYDPHGEGQYAMLGREIRAIYGILLFCVFITQYVLGAMLAAPAVLATHGLLDYTWFKVTPVVRVLLFLPPMWVILSSVFAVFAAFVILLGIWYLMVADLNMLLTLVGVPPRWLLGNKLNMEAVMVLRFLCEGIVEALPSALISTAIINSQLIRGQQMNWRFAFFWLSLISSLVRVGRELYKLLRLTYDLNACCFVTAIVDVCYHLQPHPAHSLPVASTNAAHAPNASFGRTSGELAETRSEETTAGPDVRNNSKSIDQDVRPLDCTHDSSRGVPASVGSAVVGGSTTAASSSHQMLPQPPSITVVNGVSRHSPRGCCWPGTLESDKVHPRALVIYVWVWLFLILPGIAFICIYVICPGFLARSPGNSCGTDALVSVWSNLASDVESPKDALTCLTESSA